MAPPPGYVGYGEGGVLTEAIRKKSYSVVLLDEVEKAELDVLNLFYQAFDKGMLADGEGREIDCKNVVFFLCSNLGAEHIHHLVNLQADGRQESEPLAIDAQAIGEQIQPFLENHFKPALLARMQPIIYLPLGQEVLYQIIDDKLALLRVSFAERQGIEFEVGEAAKYHLQILCIEGSSGARLIDQVIARHILPEIARMILRARLEEREITKIFVDIGEDGNFCFREGINAQQTVSSTVQDEAACSAAQDKAEAAA